MKARKIDYDLVNEYLDYNPESGILTWKKVVNAGKIKAGDIAGSLKIQGYIDIKLNKKLYKAHRLAMVLHNGEDIPEGMVVDHINHVRSDNRICNLRIVTKRANCSHLKKPGSSKYTGVYWSNRDCIWTAQITINGNRIRLGNFNREIDAHIAYQDALKEL